MLHWLDAQKGITCAFVQLQLKLFNANRKVGYAGKVRYVVMDSSR